MTQPQRGTTGQRALVLVRWLKPPWKGRCLIHGGKSYLSHHGHKLLSYHLSWGSELWASCELCPSWCCSSRHKCSYPHQWPPPWQCKGFRSAGIQNADCLVEQSMGTHWKPMHKWGLEDKQGWRLLRVSNVIMKRLINSDKIILKSCQINSSLKL